MSTRHLNLSKAPFISSYRTTPFSRKFIICMSCPHFQRGRNDLWERRQLEGSCNNTENVLPSLQARVTSPSLILCWCTFWGLLHLIFLKQKLYKTERCRTLRKSLESHSLYHSGIVMVVLGKRYSRLWYFLSSGEVLRTEDGG